MYSLPDDIWMLILDFIMPPSMKLLDWIDPEKIVWSRLSTNPAAIDMIQENPDWYDLYCKAMFMENRMLNIRRRMGWYIGEMEFTFRDKIYWDNFYIDSAEIELLRTNLDKINWSNLSQNPAAIELLRENQEKIDWYWFSLNPGMIEPDLRLFNIRKREFLRTLKV